MKNLLKFVLVVGVCLSIQMAANDVKIQPDLWRSLVAEEGAQVPFFIVFGERPSLSAARTLPKAERAQYVVRALADTASRSQAGVIGVLRGKGVQYTPFWVENKIYVAQGDLELARELARLPMVVALIPEVTYTLPPVRTEGTVGVTSLEWNIERIKADQVWSGLGTRGEGMVVANIDTGVQYTHPALVQQYRGNNGGTYTHTGNWYDPVRRTSVPTDTNGHGTHTMGTMVGSDGGSNQIGVAPGAKWIACRACATSSCSSSALIACAQWVMDPYRNLSGAGQPDVVNNSWGGLGGDSWYQSYVLNWRSSGIFPAFSNGNAGPACGTAGSPGDYPESFASGATTNLDAIASYSSRGPSAFGGIIKPNISAPGSGIRSSVPTDSYASYSGTSMASPHTAASAALIWAVQGALRGNIGETEVLLRQNATAMPTLETCGGITAGAVPNNTFGYGLLNVKAAADAASGGSVNTPPVVTITAPSNGAQVNCGVAVGFTATASDSEDGDLADMIMWLVGGTQVGTDTPWSYTFSCTSQTGSQVVTASVTDTGQATDTDSITLNVVDPNVPAAPTGLKAKVSGTTVNLTWTDNSGNETGFRVERKLKIDPDTKYAEVGTTGVNIAKFSDSGLAKGDYQYRVFAVGSGGDSLPSNTATVKVR